METIQENTALEIIDVVTPETIILIKEQDGKTYQWNEEQQNWIEG